MNNTTGDLTQYHISQTESSLLYIFATIEGLILLGSLLGNSVVFLVFYKRQNLLTPSNRLVLNLALTNFAMAALVMPSVLVSLIADRWLFGDAFCKISGLLMSVCFSACIFTLVLISLDRFCAIVTPLRYTSKITAPRIHIAVIIVWLVSILISCPPLFGWNEFSYQAEKHACTVNWKTEDNGKKVYTLILTIFCFFAPFVLMVWAYASIFHAAKANHQRTRRRSSVHKQDSFAYQDSGNGKIQNGREGSTKSLVRRPSLSSAASSIGHVFRKDEWKAAKTSLIIVFAFCICWIPYFAVIILDSLIEQSDVVPWFLKTASVMMMLLDCMLNPIVYVFRNRVVRYEIIKISSKLRRAQRLDETRVIVTPPDLLSNGHARYTRRANSEPSSTHKAEMLAHIGVSQTVLNDLDESIDESVDPTLWVFLQRCASKKKSQRSVKSVTFEMDSHKSQDLSVSMASNEDCFNISATNNDDLPGLVPDC